MATIVIGLGTGRCGTKTLSTILNSVHSSKVTHERFPEQAKWIPTFEYYDLITSDLLADIKSGYKLVGDIAIYNLNYVHMLDKTFREKGHTPKFIGLSRDEYEVVKSYKAWTEKSNDNLKDHWSVPKEDVYVDEMWWDKNYPHFFCSDKEENLHQYWKMYNGQLMYLRDYTSLDIQLYNINDMNDSEKLGDMEDFLGVQDGVLRKQVGKKVNKGKY